MKTERPNISQVNIFVSAQRHSYQDNGYFTLVFQRELDAILRNRNLTQGDKIVLIFLVAHVDNRNYITVSTSEVADALGYSKVTVYRALKKLIKMNLICRHANQPNGKQYVLTTKLLNPRFAYYGSANKLLKNETPVIMNPDGATPLLPGAFSLLDIQEEYDEQ